MKQRYLEVTFRRGQPVAAYLYLPRGLGVHAARTSDEGHGLYVDYDENEVPIGIEITSPAKATINDLNAVLARLGLEALPLQEWAPLRAA